MPDSSNFAITYPCEGSAVNPVDFSVFAFDVESALSAVTAEGVAVVSDRMFHAIGTAAIAAAAADTTMTYTGFPASVKSSGVTVNTATGDITIVATAIYELWAFVNASATSTLTITSQQIGIFVNGILYGTQKRRGFNPAVTFATTGAYSMLVPLNAGDVVTFKYQWNGTGALNSAGGGTVGLNYVANI